MNTTSPSPIPYAIIVNDDPVQLSVLSGLVRKANLKSRVFTEAEAALSDMIALPRIPDQDAGNLPVLIVTDLYMPGIDGWRFCRLLRSPEYAALNHIPILVVSATFIGEHPDQIAADLGAMAFLPSPVDGKHFIEQIQSILSGQRMRMRARLHVLIVEDSQTLARMLQKAFAAYGYQADTVFTLSEAIRAVSTDTFDLAIIDYHLPDGKGDALLNHFRNKKSDCVCVMMTTDPDPTLALSWMKQGAAAYLHKPFTPEYLIELCVKARRERSLMRVVDVLDLRTRELRESEERFRLLSERMPAYICSFLPDSTLTYVNPALAALTGVPADALVGQRLLDMLDHREKDNVRKLLASLTPENPTGSHEQYFTGTDGIQQVQEWQNRAFFDENRKPARFLAVGIDITARKYAETLLKKKSDERRLLLDTIPTQIWYLTDTDTYGAVNRAHADFLGLPIKDIAYKKLDDFISPDAAAVFREGNIRVFKTGLPVTTEEWFIQPSGERRLIQITKTPKLDEQGRVEFVVCAGNDITLLRSLERRFRTIFEKAPVGIEIFDADGKLQTVNPKFIEIFGIVDEQEIVGFNLFDDPNVTEDIRSRLKNKEMVYYESRFDFEKVRSANLYRTTRSGTIHLSVLTTLMEPNDSLDLSGYLVIIQDITQKIQYEAERLAYERRLLQLQKSESLARMAGAIAHTFNNQLAVVMGNLELAMEDLPKESDSHHFLDHASVSARRAADVSGLMLTCLGHTTTQSHPMDISDSCRQMLPLFQAALPATVTLDIQLPSPGPVIRANRHQIQQQVLTPLITNATEAMTELSGGIRLSVTAVHAADIPQENRFPVDFQPSDDVLFAALEISDTGSGIHEANIPLLFDPFFTTRFTGRGLGLSMVLGIVKSLNGCICVESKIGQGSIFQVFLPMLPEDLSQSRIDRPIQPQNHIGSGAVLLAEDEEMVRDVATVMLKRIGFEVIPANDGVEAINLYRKNKDRICLVFSDLTMPNMGGVALLKALRAIRPCIPVILVTGYEEEQALDSCVSEKPQAILQKPYTLSELKEAVAKALDSNAAPPI